MPLYDFKCRSCEAMQEIFSSIADCPEKIKCDCGGEMKKIITLGHGGIFLDEPSWLSGESGEQIRGALQDTERLAAGLDKPITTRSEHARFLEEHGVVPVERGNNLWMV